MTYATLIPITSDFDRVWNRDMAMTLPVLALGIAASLAVMLYSEHRNWKRAVVQFVLLAIAMLILDRGVAWLTYRP